MSHRIAILTDFGTRDPYVAAMKGVIASRTDVALFDLTHNIAPFDVLEAAWHLAAIEAYWPAGTIFVCVVDPGVGTARRIVAVERANRIFLAPDNGLLTFIWQRGAARAISIEDDSLFLEGGSSTFHGRDRFAPVAAAIANGMPVDRAGPPVESIELLRIEPPLYGGSVRGSVVAIDRFGNVVTDIEAARIPFTPFGLRTGGIVIERIERTYGDAAPGAFLVVGSSGHVEVSVANGSAANMLGIRRLDRVEVFPLPRAI